MSIPPPPGPDDPIWQDAERERAFWREHYEEFQGKYPDQFVAVHEGCVLAHAYDIRDLILMLKDKGFEPTQVWVHSFPIVQHLAL
jgi:hypothetical protein